MEGAAASEHNQQINDENIMEPRSYQVELFERACESNTIVCLKTGAGKTFIAVMLIKEHQHEILGAFSQAKRTFFLVPKVPLVFQQAKVIEDHTMLTVGRFWGGLGVDYWDLDKWTHQLEKHHVLVMTPQILVNILGAGYISMAKINLMIFDECHAATGNHPYCAIMSRYGEFQDAPRILGLTASVFNGKCRPCRVLENMTKLEKALHCRISTSADLVSVRHYATKPREVVIGYNEMPASPAHIQIYKIFANSYRIMTPIVAARKAEKRKASLLEASDIDKFGDSLRTGWYAQMVAAAGTDDDDDNEDLQLEGIDFGQSPYAILKNVNRVLSLLGMWSTKVVVERILQDLPKLRQSAEERFKSSDAEMYDVIHDALAQVGNILKRQFDGVSRVEALQGWSSGKLKRLLDLFCSLNKYGEMGREGFRTIIFVECRITAWTLSEYLKTLSTALPGKYGVLRPCFVVGHGLNLPFLKLYCMEQTEQSAALAKFRSGECNLLVATKVVEEGLDVPKCNVVIRFDPFKDYCSYVQSMGRARAEKALYLMLVPSNELKAMMDDITVYKVIEDMLHQRCHGRVAPSKEQTSVFYGDRHPVPPFYPTGKGNACVSFMNSLSLLNMYVSHLPKDRFTVLRPKYDCSTDKETDEVVCVIQMPAGCPLKESVRGQAMANKKLAKQVAAVEVCKRLHQIGELNDSLLPQTKNIENYFEELGVVKMEPTVSGEPIPGTKLRRLIYRKLVAEGLDCFPTLDAIVYLHAIRVQGRTSCSVACRQHCFGIVTTRPLPEVVPFTLYAKSKFVVDLVTPPTSIQLSDEQLQQLICCYRVLFKDIVRVAGLCLDFRPQDASSSFLVVPVVASSTQDGEVEIDWDTVDDFATFTSKEDGDRESVVVRKGAVVRPLYGEDDIRSKTLYVLEVRRDLTPTSPTSFDSCSSYKDYFCHKYCVAVTDDRQPLLHADYAPNAISVLKPVQLSTGRERPRDVMLIPELCRFLPLDECAYQHALFLPSILHRLNGLLLARQLGQSLLLEARIVHQDLTTSLRPPRMLEDIYSVMCVIDDSVIFRRDKEEMLDRCALDASLYQALTSRSAISWDDLERFEVIGDSFLKFVVSVFLFHQYVLMNDGCLSLLRSAMVKNANLCHYAKTKSIPGIANIGMFQPRTAWLPPGFVVPQALSDALVRCRVPPHLWPFSTANDQAIGLGTCPSLWHEYLVKRWSAASSNRKESPASGSHDVAGDTSNVCFDNYTHHLMSDKALADCVEAVVGVVLVCFGQRAALALLNWFGFRMPVSADEQHAGDCPLSCRAPQTALVCSIPSGMATTIYSGLDDLEQQLGYTFREKSFLRQAVVHPSYTKYPATSTYQRLEFLGDAILDFLITMKVYQSFPNMSPGDLTDLRSALVDNNTFAFLAVKYGMHKHLRYCSLTLYEAIKRYLAHHCKLSHPKDVVYMYGEDEVLELDDVEVPKALGDVFEAVAGAIYLDSGLSLQAVWNAFHPTIDELFDRYSVNLPINPVRKLFEKFPQTKFEKPVKLEGSGYLVNVLVDDRVFVGYGRIKYVAKQAAAKCALRAFNLTSTRDLKADADK